MGCAKYSLILLFSTPITVLSLVMGGHWVWLGPPVIIMAMLLGDLRPAESDPQGKCVALDWVLYAQLVVSLVALGALAWIAAPGDLFGLGALIGNWTSWPVREQHQALWVLDKVGAALSVGFLLSTNTVVAHELIHRTRDQIAMLTGRWLLAFIGDTQFSISHVYGHHVRVGTLSDPATARRGESLYRFVLRSGVGQLLEAFDIERQRLTRRRKAVFSLENRFLRGQIMTLAILAAMYVVAGASGVVLDLVAMLYAKFLYETVNYIQHYGLVRISGKSVQPRHSWDCDTWASSALLLNLTRHADHHARATVEFSDLKNCPGAPLMRYGYMGSIILSLVPPLWRRVTKAALQAWDEKSATNEERAAILAQSAGS